MLTATTTVPRAMAGGERDWVTELGATGATRDRALADLHALLLRAARFEVNRRRGALPESGERELDDLAGQAADDALLAILGKLGDYRGESRFTTWAYKFALLEAAVRMRRRVWRDREVMLDGEAWPNFADAGAGPAEQVESAEEFGALREAIATQLTRHQREVLLAIAVQGVPIDVLAERLGTTRGALYKSIHDARRKLRAAVEGGQR